MSDNAMVYVVDDDEAVRHSLGALLLAHGHAVRSFESGEAFLDAVDLQKPGCALLDLRMDGMSGLQVFETMNRRHGLLKVVFLSGHGDLPSAVTAVKDGALDWLQKPCDDGELLRAVAKAVEQSTHEARQWREQQALQQRWQALTPRQQEVARLLAQGMSSKEAARALNQLDPQRPIDPRTIDSHRSAIFLRMDVASTHELGMLVGQLSTAP